MKKIIITCLLAFSVLWIFPILAQASMDNLSDPTVQLSEDTSNDGVVTRPDIPKPDFLPGPNTGDTAASARDYLLNKSIPKAINIGTGILGIGAFIAILVAAIQMLTAYGNDEKITRAKNNLQYSIMGFVFIILSYAIVSIVVSLALPNEDDGNQLTWIPVAHAVDVDKDIDLLLPNQQTIVENQATAGQEVSLPGGDFLGEVIPAVITNIMFAVGFLIFISFMYGGVLMVTARGNEEAATKAKNILIYSAVALALVSLGYSLIYGIANLNLTKDESNPDDQVFSNQ